MNMIVTNINYGKYSKGVVNVPGTYYEQTMEGQDTAILIDTLQRRNQAMQALLHLLAAEPDADKAKNLLTGIQKCLLDNDTDLQAWEENAG